MSDPVNIIKYGSRTFGEIRSDLINYIRQQYPEVLTDFTDSSVGAMLIDLNAGVGNNLAINTDRAFQETQLEYAQQKASILNIAKNMGFNIPGNRPSVTVVDFTVNVPVKGDKPDSNYYPSLAPGAQVIGAGKVFETQDVVDWSLPVSSMGFPNRSIIPNTDNNGIIVNYSVTKREIVINGATTIFKKVITDAEVYPFYNIILPDDNILEIEGVILKEGTNYTTNPSPEEFSPIYDDTNGIKHYYEVDYLAQQKVFIENYNSSLITTDINNNLKAGHWKYVSKKFVKEYTPKGYCKITFGSGKSDVNPLIDGLLKEGVSTREFLNNFLHNNSLGEQLIPGYTLFIKYRTGGGFSSNIGAKTLTGMGDYTINVKGPRQDYNNVIKRSLKVSNPIPAIGGNNGLSIDEVRELIKYNFSSQNRSVTLTDYLVQIYKMPGKFGSPFRANAYKLNNKVVIPILSIDSEGKLSNNSNTLLKENITEYLSYYRMINDYVEIKDGKIFNLAFDIDVYVENTSNMTIANNIITIVKDYLNIFKHQMNDDLHLGELEKKILDANGVINVINVKVYNKFNGEYSMNVISQTITDQNTGEIKIINNTIYSTADSMFEIKYPEKDIKVFLRKKVYF